jgi:hypothetical protein
MFHFKLISQQVIPNIVLAKFVIIYMRTLLKFNWNGFRCIDQTGRFEHQLKERPADSLAIMKLPGLLGHGVICCLPVQVGEAVSEYLGVVSCTHTTTFSPDTSYSMSYPLPHFAGLFWTINALEKGNISRFMNHSRQPNVAIEIFFDGVLFRLAVVALKSIAIGEELTLNYGPMYWSKRQEIV